MSTIFINFNHCIIHIYSHSIVNLHFTTVTVLLLVKQKVRCRLEKWIKN